MRVVVRLAGGLGNQLFQYAAARAVALRHGAEVELDTSAFSRDPLGRRFGLGRFPIQAIRRDLGGWRGVVAATPGLWRWTRASGWSPRLVGTRFLFDRLRGYDARIAEAADTLVLTGYWQDEAYFEDISADLARELDLGRVVPPATQALGERLASTTTLAVHVRRGDFAQAGSPHGTCPVDYYQRAAAWIASQTTIDRIHLFSDDPTWAAQALRFELPVEHLPRDPSRGDDEDLWLMSCCRHLVIANSSFSWWAAWLAERRHGGIGTLVACPARWYRPEAGLIPHPAPLRWHRLNESHAPA